MTELSAHEVLTTTRAVRWRLDLERPVSRETLAECIDVALQAPMGAGALSAVHFVVVDDPDVKRAVAQVYAKGYASVVAAAPPISFETGDPRAAHFQKVMAASDHLRDSMPTMPAIVVVCGRFRYHEREPVKRLPQSAWGSVIQSAWSFCLALRARGLGTTWTTAHAEFEREMADVLEIPFDEWTQVCLLPVAYTKGTDFKPAVRQPARDVTHYNGW